MSFLLIVLLFLAFQSAASTSRSVMPPLFVPPNLHTVRCGVFQTRIHSEQATILQSCTAKFPVSYHHFCRPPYPRSLCPLTCRPFDAAKAQARGIRDGLYVDVLLNNSCEVGTDEKRSGQRPKNALCCHVTARPQPPGGGPIFPGRTV